MHLQIISGAILSLLIGLAHALPTQWQNSGSLEPKFETFESKDGFTQIIAAANSNNHHAVDSTDDYVTDQSKSASTKAVASSANTFKSKAKVTAPSSSAKESSSKSSTSEMAATSNVALMDADSSNRKLAPASNLNLKMLVDNPGDFPSGDGSALRNFPESYRDNDEQIPVRRKVSSSQPSKGSDSQSMSPSDFAMMMKLFSTTPESPESIKYIRPSSRQPVSETQQQDDSVGSILLLLRKLSTQQVEIKQILAQLVSRQSGMRIMLQNIERDFYRIEPEPGLSGMSRPRTREQIIMPPGTEAFMGYPPY